MKKLLCILFLSQCTSSAMNQNNTSVSQSLSDGEKKLLNEATTAQKYTSDEQTVVFHPFESVGDTVPEPPSTTEKSIVIGYRENGSRILALLAPSIERIPGPSEFNIHPISDSFASQVLKTAPAHVAKVVSQWQQKDKTTAQRRLLFVGPTGTGKTTIPHAIAHACKMKYLFYPSPFIANTYFGSGEINLDRIFQKAEKAAPCVLHIDELQVIFNSFRYNGTEHTMLPRLLSLLNSHNKDDILFTGTVDSIEAFKAPLREIFQHDIVALARPTHAQRVSIIEFLKNNRGYSFDPGISNTTLSNLMQGFSIRVIENLIREAACIAQFNKKTEPVKMGDFTQALNEYHQSEAIIRKYTKKKTKEESDDLREEI